MKSNLIWSKVLLVVSSVTIALFFGEVAARLLMAPPPQLSNSSLIYKQALGEQRHIADSEIGWVLSADQIKSRHRSVNQDGSLIFDVTYSIENGRRLTYKHKIIGPGIICTGASFTFGHGLPDEASWPWLLQERLPDYHVVNVASMAYGTDQALLAGRRQVVNSELMARVVVLGFGDFQIERNRSSQGWLAHIYPFGKPLYIKKGEELDYKGQVKFFSAGNMLSRSVLASHVSNKVANMLRRIPAYGDSEVKEVTVRLIIQFAKQFESKGITLVVVMMPWHSDHGASSRANQAFIIDRLRVTGIHVLVPQIPRHSNGEIDGDLFWINMADRHPNRHYNTLVANQLSNFLKTRILTR